MTTDHAHQHHQPHSHHGHTLDQGVPGFLRYARLVGKMWRSPVSDAVVGMIAPQAGENLIELGAGMGSAAVVAARSGASLLAVDPAPYMRTILKARCLLRPGRQRVTVVEGAAESIPVENGAAHALWTVNTMHHWTDLGRAVTEIQRVLKGGGRLLLVDEDFGNPLHPDHAQHHVQQAAHAHAFDVVDPVALAARFQSAGFPNATGSLESIAGRPCKVVRGLRAS